MRVAVLTFEGFNELDSFIAAAILNRAHLKALITCPGPRVTSMNGVAVEAQAPLAFAREADAVIVGSGMNTREIVRDQQVMKELKLDPARQLIGAQCSGALILAKLGLLGGVPACTDSTTKPWVQEAGVQVLDQPFVAHGNVATAGGCLSSQYLAAWIVARLAGWDTAASVLHYVAPVGEKQEYVERARRAVAPYLTAERLPA